MQNVHTVQNLSLIHIYILYQWKTDEHLLRRNTFIGDSGSPVNLSLIHI